MIVFLTGTIAAKGLQFVDLDVHGVGYRVHVPEQFSSSVAIGHTVHLFTYLQVREDAHVLFGFAQEAERDWFEMLISVSGIGPKSAIQIVNAMTVSEFTVAIDAEDIDRLCRLPGVGKKTAQRVIVELKDKVKSAWFAADHLGEVRLEPKAQTPVEPVETFAMDVIEALKSLGYPDKQAFDVVETVLAATPDLSTEDTIKKCLQLLYQQPIGSIRR